MDLKEKELLLKDLSARLPYHVIVSTGEENLELVKVDILNEKVYLFSESFLEFDISEIKPYLRSMSSMTEDEIIGLYKAFGFGYYSHFELSEEWISFKDSIKNNMLFIPYPIWTDDYIKGIDFLLRNHFNYRGLIEKELALKAPEGMYVWK